jgi:hypothetical protein
MAFIIATGVPVGCGSRANPISAFAHGDSVESRGKGRGPRAPRQLTEQARCTVLRHSDITISCAAGTAEAEKWTKQRLKPAPCAND